MIENLYIAPTDESPKVDFNSETGLFEISGISISKEADRTFGLINNWLKGYSEYPQDVSQLIINLDYFNISTSKHLLDLLYKLKQLEENEKFVSIEWHYNEEEVDMLELGQDYEMMVHLPFKYVGHKLMNKQVC
ncbi:MAG: DUF1987 domain-containing protein [Crocinitomicaceae bacterium]